MASANFLFRLKCCEIAKGDPRRAKELYRELYEFMYDENWGAHVQPPPMPVQEPATPEPSPEPAYYARNTSNY